MDYITEIILFINQTHHCVAVHRATVPAAELFLSRTVWDGDVEVFDLANHPKAKRAYAWGSPKREINKPREITIVVEIPSAEAKTAEGDARFNLTSLSSALAQAPNSVA